MHDHLRTSLPTPKLLIPHSSHCTPQLEKRVGNSKTTQIDIIAENIIRFSVENGALTAALSVVLLGLGVTYLASRPRYYQALRRRSSSSTRRLSWCSSTGG